MTAPKASTGALSTAGSAAPDQAALPVLDLGAAAGGEAAAAAPGKALCACPSYRGRAVTDSAVHEAWHELVVEQGGPAGLVDAVTLRAARGFKTPTLDGETVLDERARATGKRASGALRRASR